VIAEKKKSTGRGKKLAGVNEFVDPPPDAFRRLCVRVGEEIPDTTWML
jgi:hypothetical protein